MPEDEREPASPHLTSDEWLDVLHAGDVTISGRLPWSSNYSFLARVRLDGQSVNAVYKPGKGERHLWDFGGELFRREIAAYELSSALGLGLVPETVLRLDGPLDEGSLQRFVDADFSQHYFSLFEEGGHEERLRELAGFDLLANNADRKSGHVLIDSSGAIWGIDNGLCFHREPKLRTVIWEFAGERLPQTIVEACEAVAGAAPERLHSLLSEDECDALCARAQKLVRRPRFPHAPDDYRAYPWPLV